MKEIPSALLEEVPLNERPTILAWWEGLLASDQAELTNFFDERWENSFLGQALDEERVIHGGRFLPSDDAWLYGEWEEDWREYLIEHPDVLLATNFVRQSFITGGGQLRIWVNWERTTFPVRERPPSERLRSAGGIGRG